MDLMQLFYEREAQYVEKTQLIYDEIPIAIEAIGHYLDSFPANNFHNGIVRWEDINLYDDSVRIFGLLTYNVGTIIDINGEQMEITSDNANYFQRIIRITLPVDLILTGTEESIFHYLVQMHATEQMHQTELISDHTVSPKFSTQYDDDLDGLSDEQKCTYKLFKSVGTLN